MIHKFLVSSDISGILGKRSDWDYIWGKVLKDPNFSGYEMIGWKWSHKFIGSNFKHRVTGIHGQTAGWNEGRSLFGKTTLFLLNLLFLNIDNLIGLGETTNYILLHRGTLSTRIKNTLILNKDKFNFVCVENDLVPDSLNKTVQEIEFLIKNGVKAGLMFDIVHFLREPFGVRPDINRWDLLISALNRLKTLNFPINCHFPIGEYENDSLPIPLITDTMWNELSKTLASIPIKYIVLENQASRRYSLFLTKKDKLYFRKRTEEVYDLLKKHKII